ncbi:MAG: hypothetical protein WA441_10990 [Methyloceanibacter sp.]
MLTMWPADADAELAQRYSEYSAECYAILLRPVIWNAVERVATKLIERGKLDAIDVLETLGGEVHKHLLDAARSK